VTAPQIAAALLDWSAYTRVLLATSRPDEGRRLNSEQLEAFEEAVRADRLHVCTPFRLEARYSAQTAEDFAELSEELDGFRQTDADADTWLLAERAQRELAADPTVSHRVKLADLLVAAVASQHRLGVLHYDADYDLISRHTTLDFESVWIAPAGSID
jgi:predicted nucleic acid-binding protein